MDHIKIIKHSQNYIIISHPNIQNWGNEFDIDVFINYNNYGYLKLDKYIKSNNTLTLFNIRGNVIFKFKLLLKNKKRRECDSKSSILCTIFSASVE